MRQLVGEQVIQLSGDSVVRSQSKTGVGNLFVPRNGLSIFTELTGGTFIQAKI